MGVYRHYKGPLYQLIGVAHDANAEELFGAAVAVLGLPERQPASEPLGERIVVVYIGLQLDTAHEGPRLAVRTMSDFVRVVHDDGQPCWSHVTMGSGASMHECSGEWSRAGVQRRFTWLGEYYQTWMTDPT